MKKNLIYGLLIICLLILVYIYSLNNESGPKVCYSEKCFDVEIADDSLERTRGLMFRDELDKNEGMLFIFDSEGIYSFWMKNTPLSLDIIWIDNNFNVVYIAKNTAPESIDLINPLVESRYVLEVNAGLSSLYGIEIGSRLQFRGV